MADPKSGNISFIEIGSRHAAVTRKFFGAVFGWPCHDDAWLQTPTLKAGTHGNDPAPQIYVFFGVPDLAVASTNIRAAGGEAGEIKGELGFGRFVQCRDPGGIHFGLHQA